MEKFQLAQVPRGEAQRKYEAEREGVINLKLTNSKNKVMAFSHPPYFSVFLEAAVQDMDERSSSIIVAFNFFIAFHTLCNCFCSFNYPFSGLHAFYYAFYILPPSLPLHVSKYTISTVCATDFFLCPYPGSLLHITRLVPGEPVSLQGWERKTDRHTVKESNRERERKTCPRQGVKEEKA